MGIKARYDFKEDRMLLILEPKDAKEAERRVYWLTRRQWVGLYAGLGPVKPEKPEAKQPPVKPQPLPESLTAGAQLLDGVKLRRKDDTVQIGFVSGEKTSGMQVSGESLEQLKRMMQQQADRAGWDPNAAVVRLRAAAQANAAVKKAAAGKA
jgi:hypothetical protein